jgi:hypothetical protein
LASLKHGGFQELPLLHFAYSFQSLWHTLSCIGCRST